MSPPAQLRQAKWQGGEQVRSQQNHRATEPQARRQRGCRQGCRGRAGNLPPPAGVLEPWRPRPVAPPRASCRDVVGSPVAAAGGAELGQRRGKGGGQVPGPAAGPHWARTRGDGDARLRVCNARAPRPVCVSPRSPSFPPLLWPAERQADHYDQAAPGSAARRDPGWRPRSGGAPQPRAPARRAGVRAGPAASWLHGGLDSRRLQAPPAGRPGSSPFLSTPCSVPHALQGSQTGLQQPGGPQSDLTLESVRGRLCVRAAARSQDPGETAQWN